MRTIFGFAADMSEETKAKERLRDHNASLYSLLSTYQLDSCLSKYLTAIVICTHQSLYSNDLTTMTWRICLSIPNNKNIFVNCVNRTNGLSVRQIADDVYRLTAAALNKLAHTAMFGE